MFLQLGDKRKQRRLSKSLRPQDMAGFENEEDLQDAADMEEEEESKSDLEDHSDEEEVRYSTRQPKTKQ